ncbi:hypothetical protein DL770_009360 [Monosporascus sp. CRB-9-2]|nr:hypothetical protein DL770_009360 [Monosporascus sp. CRB-9-2]
MSCWVPRRETSASTNQQPAPGPALSPNQDLSLRSAAEEPAPCPKTNTPHLAAMDLLEPGTDERPPPAQEPAAAIEVKLWLDCVICKSPMLRFPTPTFPVRGEPPLELNLITVLFCGHVFHSDCMREWLRVCKEGSPDNGPRIPSCPGCREPLLYRACGHSIHLMLLSPSRPEEIDAKLPDLRDEGGEIPDRCWDCQLIEMTQAVKNLTRLIREHGSKDIRSEQDRRRREREYTSAAARAPYKDDMDRESLKPKAHENTQSGTDDQTAQNEDAAFNPDKTSPESERAAAGTGNEPNTNPLEESPANTGFAGNTTGAKEDVRRGGGGNHQKPSGSGDAPKSGKITNN